MTTMMPWLDNMESYTVKVGNSGFLGGCAAGLGLHPIQEKVPVCWTELCVYRDLHGTSSPPSQIMESLDIIFSVLIKPSVEKDYITNGFFFLEKNKSRDIKLWFRMITRNQRESVENLVCFSN